MASHPKAPKESQNVITSAPAAPEASTSRLLIKPLAANVTAQDLRDYFKQSGFHLTEAQVMTDKSSKKSRGFGFVGLPTVELANQAITKLNGGWMYGKKIALATARDIKPAAAETTSHSQTTKRKPAPVAEDAAVDDTISDMEYLQKRKKRRLDGESGENEETSEATPVNTRRRIFIRGLLHTATEEELRQYFALHNHALEDLSIPQSTRKNTESADFLNKGIAFIDFVDASDALKAVEELSGKPFGGRNLFMHLIAAERPLKSRTGPATGKESEKQIQDSLVLNQDAVLSATANRLGVSKSEVLDPTSSASATKLAIAETAIVEETRAFFLQRGIDLDLFSAKRGGKKSKSTLLIKNLPGDMSESSLGALLGGYGQVQRLLIPASATIALVEYDSPASAESAHSALAYKKMGNSVLYVEKPLATIWDSVKDADDSETATKEQLAEIEAGLPSSTLFVKNLAFKTRESDFVKLFSAMPGFIFARIQAKAAKSQTPAVSQSMGYGFVGFKSTEDASRALAAMNGYRLDGHDLRIAFAQNSEEGEQDKAGLAGIDAGKVKSTTLVIKNVPFEANTKDLKELISAFSTIKSLRLPKGANGRTRGFAFVDFPSKEEAARAIQGLKHTHLYGRHLVMEPQTKASLSTALGETVASS